MLQTVMLAAGRSTRIAPIANGLPKPLLPIEGVPILFRNLKWIAQCKSIQSIWVNLHYESALLQQEIVDFSRQVDNLAIHFSHEEEILGTAGGVKKIAPHCTDDSHYLVIYGDNLYGFDLEKMIDTHFSQGNLATIALFDDRIHMHTGIAGGKIQLNDQLQITHFIEGIHANSFHYVNAGVYLLSPEIISRIPSNQFCDFGRDIFPYLLLENVPLTGYIIDGYCLGLDTPGCFEVARKLIDQKKVELL